MNFSQIPDDLGRAVVDRIAVLDKSNKPLAEALRRIALKWQSPVVNLLLLSDLKNGRSDSESILKLLSERKNLREKQSTDVFDIRTGSQTAIGISPCLMEDQNDAAPVSVTSAAGFPFRTTIANVVAAATELDIAGVAPGSSRVGRGTAGVALLGLNLQSPGITGITSDVKLYAFAAVLEDTAFHPGRTARNHLRVLAVAGEHPPERVDAVLDQVGLTAAANRRVKGYSMGMRQRLAIAGALNGKLSVRRSAGPSLADTGRDNRVWAPDVTRTKPRTSEGRGIVTPAVSSRTAAKA
jgi:hypothetical protein